MFNENILSHNICKYIFIYDKSIFYNRNYRFADRHINVLLKALELLITSKIN